LNTWSDVAPYTTTIPAARTINPTARTDFVNSNPKTDSGDELSGSSTVKHASYPPEYSQDHHPIDAT
jgi:hypothetical protein